MTSDQTPLLDDEEDTEEDEDDVVIEEDAPVDNDDEDLTASLNSDPTTSLPPPISSQQQPSDDQARKLFQRLWTDEDEIGLLQGFLDYSTQRGTSQNNPALFYDYIKSKLNLDFNKNQLVEKLRRLKKKYRNVLVRISSGKEISFKSPHDHATFEIATKIWGTDHNHTSSSKDHHVQHQNYHQQQQMLQRRIDVDDDMPPNFSRPSTNLNLNFASDFNSSNRSDRAVVDERRALHKSSKKRIRERTEDESILMDQMGAMRVPASASNVQIPIWPPGVGLSNPGMAEEKLKNRISPLFGDMFERSGGGRGFMDGIVSPVPLSFASPMVNLFGMEVVDDRWRKQQILELEVYSKRLELVQEQIKLTLEELRSTGS